MLLNEYLRVIRRYWLMVSLAAVLGVLCGGLASAFMPPKYHAAVQIYVSVRGESQVVGDLAQGSTIARQSVSTYAAVAKTDSVLAPVIDELDLDTTPSSLASSLESSAPANQSLVNIVATDQDAKNAANIANAVGKSLKNIVENELEASTAKGQPSLVSLNVVQPASVPNSPVSPKIPLNLLIGGVIGLLAGIAIAILRSKLDTRIHSIKDIEELSEIPILGGTVFDPDADKFPLVVHSSPRSPRSESFRTLRTNLQFLTVKTPDQSTARSFVISSASPNEGKSTTASNIALALAETGSRVLLVDADLRRPSIAKLMGLEGGAGLTDILIGKVEIGDVVQQWGTNELYVLPSGKIPPNPSELLGSSAMEDFLHVANEYFEYIIIDSPPILLVTDAAVVGKWTDGILLVAASGSTRKQALSGAISSLSTAGARLKGMIVTMLPTKGPDRNLYGAYGAYGDYSLNLSSENEAFIASANFNMKARRLDR